VLIAVIDTRTDTTHPEFDGVNLEHLDAIGIEEKPHTHGTATVGAIVARAKLMGVAPGARILAITALGTKEETAEGTTFYIAKAIDLALARGARIINMSFTGPNDPQIARRIAQARQQGVILIAAVGNAGPKSPPLYPAAYPDVVAVTATDADDKLFKLANQGKHVAVSAPGVELLLPAPDDTYQMTSGTSFAAAYVSGIVALILERRPDLRPDEVRRILTATARDLGPKGIDSRFGAGLVDAYRAIMSSRPETAQIAPPALLR
jgi:subtilisin family serine protease